MDFPYNLPDSYGSPDHPYRYECEALVELLLTPRPLCNGVPLVEIEYEMAALWKRICYDRMVDHEYRYIYANLEDAVSNQEPWEDELEDVQRAQTNALGWIEDARREFNRLVLPFSYRAASRQDYVKHYANPNASHKANLAKSQTVGVLALDLDDAAQSAIYRELCLKLWASVIINPNGDFVVETNRHVGWSRGLECRHLVYKLDKDAQLFHCFPVLESDVPQYLTGAVHDIALVVGKGRFDDDEEDKLQGNFVNVP